MDHAETSLSWESSSDSLSSRAAQEARLVAELDGLVEAAYETFAATRQQNDHGQRAVVVRAVLQKLVKVATELDQRPQLMYFEPAAASTDQDNQQPHYKQRRHSATSTTYDTTNTPPDHTSITSAKSAQWLRLSAVELLAEVLLEKAAEHHPTVDWPPPLTPRQLVFDEQEPDVADSFRKRIGRLSPTPIAVRQQSSDDSLSTAEWDAEPITSERRSDSLRNLPFVSQPDSLRDLQFLSHPDALFDGENRDASSSLSSHSSSPLDTANLPFPHQTTDDASVENEVTKYYLAVGIDDTKVPDEREVAVAEQNPPAVPNDAVQSRPPTVPQRVEDNDDEDSLAYLPVYSDDLYWAGHVRWQMISAAPLETKSSCLGRWRQRRRRKV